MFVIDWLNANSGALTFIATVVIAASAGVTVWLTRSLAKENRLLREAGMEPRVVAYLKLDPHKSNLVKFVLANVGQGPARDVEFTFQAGEDDFENHAVFIRNSSDRTLTTMLPQGERIETLFGLGAKLMEEPKLEPFTVSVKFHDLSGKDHSDEYKLNVAQFTGFVPGSTPEYESVRALERIETGIGRLVKAIRVKQMINKEDDASQTG